MNCLHNQTICPEGQIVHTIHNSFIRCSGVNIPVLSAHCTPDMIPRAAAPKFCPLRKPTEEVAAKLTTPNWTGRHSVIPKVQKSHKRMFSKEQIRDIRIRAENGETYGAIAKSYGANGTTIGNVVNRVTYKDVG